MTFSPYYSPTYQPYQSYYQPYQYQPVQQQAQTQTSPAVNQSSIIWVSGDSEAAMYPIAPNNAVALWAKDGKTIYLKSADATGKPNMTVYDLVERNQNASETDHSATVNMDTFATKDDLSAIVTAMAGLKSDIDTMKGDLYGLSGRKKSASKKAEVTDDE